MLPGGCTQCVDNLEGAKCNKEGQTLEHLTLKPGYWRTGPT
eukprot:CAMPEP_0205930492 /NCGR_PEP_ID=MMETSP1325-20131115/25925_1 /ASSEMBLY_ACC=CAM_ASM_000708 /TAXON_ID=236786 /ORGANISM="Florenciella sp., Strain RCC1007" /LENGTH=40 /DNA_ID= /DNA_START= /DNA_END= /DNA_ORIENTATION=